MVDYPPIPDGYPPYPPNKNGGKSISGLSDVEVHNIMRREQPKTFELGSDRLHAEAQRIAFGVRVMSIERALIWAFRSECASVDFEEEARPDLYQSTVSTAWLVAQRGRIGCKIDGGGRSLPHDDAEIIASAVSALAPQLGGSGMAIQIARLARIGDRPDWMRGARARVVPVHRVFNQHGWMAGTADSRMLGGVGWQHVRRRTRKRGIVSDPVLYCPVTINPTPAQIAAARRNYLDWWGALLDLAASLRSMGLLSSIALTSDMPPMTPWRKEGR
ncbi:hypothetical protein OE699_01920 [Sedimentimonas flavescens]|uniref:Uncharacterized protein n=1 Tax=Sedimentimonas flavescens TaxID=2851012 RepID=A0ABT2ZVC5_9RHOB|nr:hypothetical protein [Sedimentimonas flavescens]MCV2877596.1 hypothetical protein [Sedimentimonas flavescens]